jgi:anti-sigma factor RsiW
MTRFDDAVLVAYVDGELDESTARSVAAVIEQDPETRQKVELLRRSGALVGEVFRQPKYQQVAAGLAQTVSTPAQSRWARLRPRWRFALPIAASIVAALIGFGVGYWRGAAEGDFAERLLDEVAEYHVVFAREREHQVEVTADRLDEIQSWLGERLGRKLVVPDLSDRGLMFRGARLLVVGQRPVAQLVYAFPGRFERPFALCIAAGSPQDIQLRTEREGELNLALWARKGFIYVLAGWIDPSVLTALAGELAPKLDDV